MPWYTSVVECKSGGNGGRRKGEGGQGGRVENLCTYKTISWKIIIIQRNNEEKAVREHTSTVIELELSSKC